MPPPHSHFLKANWAGKLLEQLNTSVGDWFEAGQHFTHEIVADPKTPEAFLLVVGADSIPMAPFGLVVGDIVNNLRGSLDHIVYALALDEQPDLSETRQGETQFPIVGDRDSRGEESFKANQARRIGALSPDAQELIENVQPYRLASEWERHPLLHLQSLSNVDKHRFLHLGAAYTSSFSVTRCRVEGDVAPLPRLVRERAVVARLGKVAPLDPTDSLKDLITPHMTVAFAQAPLQARPVVEILSEIHQFIGEKVLAPLHAMLRAAT